MSDYNMCKELSDAIKKCEESHGIWANKLDDSVKSRKLTKLDERRVKSFLGRRPYKGRIRASDLKAAYMLSHELIDVVDTYWKAMPNNRWFHLTLLADELILSERDPCLLLKRLKGKAYKEVQELDLNGIIFLDENPLPNHPQGGEGGSFLFHVHILAYTDKPFDLTTARRKLAASRSWSCKFGAPATNIIEITEKRGNPCFWAAYDSKPPYEAKNFVAADGKMKMRSTMAGYRGHVALRLVEGLSQLALGDTVISVGEAKDLRQEAMRRVLKWHRSRWAGQKPIKPFNERALWNRVWRRSRVKGYRRWSIIGSTL